MWLVEACSESGNLLWNKAVCSRARFWLADIYTTGVVGRLWQRVRRRCARRHSSFKLKQNDFSCDILSKKVWMLQSRTTVGGSSAGSLFCCLQVFLWFIGSSVEPNISPICRGSCLSPLSWRFQHCRLILSADRKKSTLLAMTWGKQLLSQCKKWTLEPTLSTQTCFSKSSQLAHR